MPSKPPQMSASVPTVSDSLEAAVARVRRVMNGESIDDVYMPLCRDWATTMGFYIRDLRDIAEHFIREHGKKGGDYE